MAEQPNRSNRGVSRRQFLQTTGAAAAAGALASFGGCQSQKSGATFAPPKSIAPGTPIELLADFNHPVISSPQAQWALERLNQALHKANVPLLVHKELKTEPAF